MTRSVNPLMMAVPLVLLLATVAGCGTSGASVAKQGKTAVARTSGGDIPDTATYLRYHSSRYSIEYVEGWATRALPRNGVRMSDIDSSVTVALRARPSGSLSAYVHGPGMTQTAGEFQGFVRKSLASVHLPAGLSVRLTFKARSAPDPVTGKQVALTVDRYFVPGTHEIALITLATPVGVDNIDAFRRIARSFSWTKP